VGYEWVVLVVPTGPEVQIDTSKPASERRDS
jgi:hypothetical protein